MWVKFRVNVTLIFDKLKKNFLQVQHTPEIFYEYLMRVSRKIMKYFINIPTRLYHRDHIVEVSLLFPRRQSVLSLEFT